jgi:hypothetical protein
VVGLAGLSGELCKRGRLTGSGWSSHIKLPKRDVSGRENGKQRGFILPFQHREGIHKTDHDNFWDFNFKNDQWTVNTNGRNRYEGACHFSILNWMFGM